MIFYKLFNYITQPIDGHFLYVDYDLSEDRHNYKKIKICLGSDEQSWPEKKIKEIVENFRSKTRGFENIEIQVETVEEAIKHRQMGIAFTNEEISKLRKSNKLLSVKHYILPGKLPSQSHPDNTENWYIPMDDSEKEFIFNKKDMALHEQLEKYFPLEIICRASGEYYQGRRVFIVMLSVSTSETRRIYGHDFKFLTSEEFDQILTTVIPTIVGFPEYVIRLQTLDEAVQRRIDDIKRIQKDIENIKKINQ
jgi:hypothetical protein